MPLSPEEIAALPQEVQDLIEAAKQMPRVTPKAGCASTVHTYEISAGTVWTLDRALINLGLPTYPLARPEDRGEAR